MMLTRSRLIALMIGATVATGYAFQNNSPWPPGLQPVSDRFSRCCRPRTR